MKVMNDLSRQTKEFRMFTQFTSTRTRQAALAVGAAILASTALSGTADAKKPFKNLHVGVHIGGSGIYIGHHYHRGWRGHRCRWVKRRAMVTGSPYWWKRYRRCVRHHYW
jgi:hypothetical protein